MSELIKKAFEFSENAHKGQLRKYTNEDYIVHPIAVFELLQNVGITNEHILVSALLHDTVEDTPTTLQDVEQNFGTLVCRMVEDLTDVYTKEAFPNIRRKERKMLECYRLWKVNSNSKSIKLADLIDNTKSILEYDKNFSKIYIAEKRELLQVLEGGHPSLMETARKSLLDAEKKLKELYILKQL